MNFSLYFEDILREVRSVRISIVCFVIWWLICLVYWTSIFFFAKAAWSFVVGQWDWMFPKLTYYENFITFVLWKSRNKYWGKNFNLCKVVLAVKWLPWRINIIFLRFWRIDQKFRLCKFSGFWYFCFLFWVGMCGPWLLSTYYSSSIRFDNCSQISDWGTGNY